MIISNKNNILKITGSFLAVKFIIFFIVLLTPGQYDTSSSLLFEKRPTFSTVNTSLCIEMIKRLIQRLTNWDMVYFVNIARRGHEYEHEWAFGFVYPGIIRYFGSQLTKRFQFFHILNSFGENYVYSATTIIIGNISHYFATIVLYYLTRETFNNKKIRSPSGLPFITALLYTISPAGVFLATGYTESLFALLSFTGLYLRLVSLDKLSSRFRPVSNPTLYVISGMIFASANLIRSNGILWGILFLYDCFIALVNFRFKEVAYSIIAGIMIFLSLIYSQYVPFTDFCPERGEWCLNSIPSIYNYIQSKYWNIGFLNYWTPNNVPNFLFALPTIYLIINSSIHYYHTYPFATTFPIIYAQIVLLILSLCLFHIQILTRIGSQLPVIYWYVADLVIKSQQTEGKSPRGSSFGKIVVWYFITWSFIQAALYSAFLQPA